MFKEKPTKDLFYITLFEAVAALSGGGGVDVDTVQGSRKFVGVREGGK